MALIFPRAADKYVRLGAALLALTVLGGVGAYAYFSHPAVLDTGYMPEQPVPYSHKLHAGNMGMDCYYCHNTVFKAGFAAVPPTQTCMNCHNKVKTESPALTKVRESWATGEPVRWVQIHKLPDYVYFNHQAHVTSGVSCKSCHGRVDQMVEVRQVQPLSMSWCLDCHRNPTAHIRPVEFVTKLDWQPPSGQTYESIGAELVKKNNINPPVNCGACHR